MVVLTLVAAWCAKESDIMWMPALEWFFGIILLGMGRPRVGNSSLRRSMIAWIVFIYAVALGLFVPIPHFQRGRHSELWFVLMLVPLTWVGVTGPGRGEWVRGIGAWLVLFSEFSSLIYNITHGTSGIGCWAIYLD
jgi:hypothetical protein